MTDKRAVDTAEFKELLDELYPRWNAFLARSYSSLRNIHADLMQQSAEDLIRYAREKSWADIADWRALGFRILHRRIADNFRNQARAWSFEPISDEIQASDPGSDPELVAHYSAQLQKLVFLITGMDDKDRHLLLAEILDDEPRPPGPLSVSQRKRISRLRGRLRDAVEGPAGNKTAQEKE